MIAQRVNAFAAYALALGLVLTFAAFAQAQQDTGTTGTTSASVRTVSSGQRMTIKGVVIRREADTFTVRDANNVDTVVRLADNTDVRTNGGFFRRGRNYSVTSILRGLNLEVRGRGDESGQLVAERVRFSDSDLRVAQSVQAGVSPVEARVGNVEQNAQRMAGQLDELAAISNAARGGARAAQETADAAVYGVMATNERISALDEYTPQSEVTVNFRVNSYVISPEARAQLDDIARHAQSARGFVVEVRGFTDTTGNTNLNRRLSQQRADAVVRYLVENHNIPLRRIVTPFGYGEMQPVADNTTPQGRAQNRRVEVRLLVNRGLSQPAPTLNTPATPNATSSVTP